MLPGTEESPRHQRHQPYGQGQEASVKEDQVAILGDQIIEAGPRARRVAQEDPVGGDREVRLEPLQKLH